MALPSMPPAPTSAPAPAMVPPAPTSAPAPAMVPPAAQAAPLAAVPAPAAAPPVAQAVPAPAAAQAVSPAYAAPAPAPTPAPTPAPAALAPLPPQTSLPTQVSPTQMVPSQVAGMPTQLAYGSNVSMTGNVGGGPLASELEEMGISGLDFTQFGIFPIISLANGRFATSDGSLNLGTEFMFRIQGSRKKLLYKVAGLPDSDPRNKVTYSYDGVTAIDGRSVSAHVEEWAKDGLAFEFKQYLEVTAALTDNSVVLLSVPNSSQSRLAQAIVTMQTRSLSIKETWIKASIGPQVTNAIKPFFPWAFSVAA